MILLQASHSLARFDDFLVRLKDVAAHSLQKKEIHPHIHNVREEAEKGFEAGLDDDLNVSRALAALSELIREVNILIDENTLSGADARDIRDFFQRVDGVFGFFSFEEELIPEEIEQLIKERTKVRREKNFIRADEIRSQLLRMGIVLEDTAQGTRWKKSSH